MLMCPHCGWQYDPNDERYPPDTAPHELVPYHDDYPPLRSCCPGSKQHPRNPETDRRPLWKDLINE